MVLRGVISRGRLPCGRCLKGCIVHLQQMAASAQELLISWACKLGLILCARRPCRLAVLRGTGTTTALYLSPIMLGNSSARTLLKWVALAAE